MNTPTILTVCLGNICRSPTAEAALQQAAASAGVDITVRSAGTGTWHAGQPPNPPMVRAAAAKGLTLAGIAQQVTPDMLRQASLVVAMDQSNLADLERLAAQHNIDTPIELFRRFDPAVAGANDADLDVPDPYEGPDEGFDAVVEICLRTAPHIIAAVAD